MVTAGVFLILRWHLYLNILNLIIINDFFRTFTTVFAGSIGVFNMILKKLLHILHVVNRLFIFNMWFISIFFKFFSLFNHAFFKALYF